MSTILIVEDQAEVRKMLTIALKKAKYQVIEASDGEEALRMVSAQRPAVVLLDISMPGTMNGFEVCQALKADPALKETFIIMVSGLSDQKDFDQARSSGANAYFVKPFRFSRLIEVVQDHPQLTEKFVLVQLE